MSDSTSLAWTSIFEDPKRGTRLYINAHNKTFQFVAPDGYNSGIIQSKCMIVHDTFGTSLTFIMHWDSKVILTTRTVKPQKDLLSVLLMDKETWQIYRLNDPRGLQ